VKLSNLMRNEPNRIESKTRKNFLILKVLKLREIFEPNRNEINRIPSTHQIREFHILQIINYFYLFLEKTKNNS